MSNFNSKHNRAVWFDIPVADLDRAARFYQAVLAIGVQRLSPEAGDFCLFDHGEGNGGSLVLDAGGISASGGILVYMNVEGRIRAALEQVVAQGGEVLQALHGIGPYGFRAVVRDSEGNRIALHASTDA